MYTKMSLWSTTRSSMITVSYAYNYRRLSVSYGNEKCNAIPYIFKSARFSATVEGILCSILANSTSDNKARESEGSQVIRY
jgi:hypothetical protein